MVDLDVTIIDPRTAFASQGRFPGKTLIAEWPGAALQTMGLDRYTAVVVLAHVANIDDEGLVAALKAPCFYIGALGSSRNQSKRRERLLAQGFTLTDIGRISGPIGLDIGAVTPAEIAVSIIGEVVSIKDVVEDVNNIYSGNASSLGLLIINPTIDNLFDRHHGPGSIRIFA